eukprot:Rhum_TRINITY_DN15000_c1_g1::Rhum_TRINITY_DN15000_c1_g1_i5::g.133035::m.133035
MSRIITGVSVVALAVPAAAVTPDPYGSSTTHDVTACSLDTGESQCVCPPGMAMIGMAFTGVSGSRSLRDITAFECASARPDPSAHLLMNCRWADVGDSFDSEGWSTCQQSEVMAGFGRSPSFSGLLYTLERLYCCEMVPPLPTTKHLRKSDVQIHAIHSCFLTMDPTGVCRVPDRSYLNGMYRTGTVTGCTTLDCITGFSYFNYYLPDDTPTLTQPETPTLTHPATPTLTLLPDPTATPTILLTAVPDTAVPDTDVPDTAVPSTAVTATDAPGLPATTLSLTAEPTSATSAPALGKPQPTATAVLPDDVSTREPVPPTLPATDVPDTPVPPDTLPAPLAKQIMEQREVTESVSAGAAIASAAGVGGGAGSAMRLALVASECVVGDQRKLSWAFHPTGIRVGDNVYVGAIVGNMACVAGFALLASATLSLVNRFAPMRWVMRLAESTDSQGLLRFPSAPLFVFQWFYQSLSLCGFTLLISSEGGHLNMIGIATCGVCLGVPIYIVRVLVKGVPESATYAEDPEHSGLLYTIVCGAGEWVNTFRSRLWVQRYASIVRTWRQKAVYFAFIDLMASFFLSGISALETENWIGCGHVRTAQALVFFGLTCLEGRYWPHARWRDTMVDFVLLGGQCAALGLLAAAYYSGNADHAGFPTSQLLLMLVGYILVAKVVADILTELYIIMTGRRQRIQHLMWKPGRRHTITKSEGRHSFRDPEYAFETHRTSSTVAQSMPSSATTIEADEFTESLDTPVTKARKGSELLSAPPLYQNERQAPHPVERSCYGAPRSPLLATREDVSLL